LIGKGYGFNERQKAKEGTGGQKGDGGGSNSELRALSERGGHAIPKNYKARAAGKLRKRSDKKKRKRTKTMIHTFRKAL